MFQIISGSPVPDRSFHFVLARMNNTEFKSIHRELETRLSQTIQEFSMFKLEPATSIEPLVSLGVQNGQLRHKNATLKKRIQI
jgi:hypothetical protein